MVENRVQAALALRQVAQGCHQEVQAALDFSRYLLAAQEGRPGRGQLNTQRHPIHHSADLSRRGQFVSLQDDLRAGAAGALVEETDGIVVVGAVELVGWGDGQALGDEDVFALQVEPLPGGGQELDAWCVRQHLAEQAGAGQQMLQVVQHQQHLHAGQMAEQLQPQLCLAAQCQAHGLSDGRNDGGR